MPAHRIAPSPNNARRGRARSICGMELHDADGRLVMGSDSFASTEGFFGYETPSGGQIFSDPGSTDFTFVEASGRTHHLTYLRGDGWYSRSKSPAKRLSKTSAVKPRWRKLLRNLFSSLGERVSWMATRHPYPFLELQSTGAVVVEGAPLAAGDSPVVTQNGPTVSRPGVAEVCVHDDQGARDRFRYTNTSWKRLVTKSRAALSELSVELVDVCGTGELEFGVAGRRSMIVTAGPFLLHLGGGRTLVRVDDPTAPIWAFDGSDDVREFVLEGGKIYSQQGTRDKWVFHPVGVPGGIKQKPSAEPCPGLILYSDASCSIVGKLYTAGQAIDIKMPGGISAQRDGGFHAILVVKTGILRTAFCFGVDGEWYQGQERVADGPYHSYARHCAQHSWLDYVLCRWEAFADEAPGILRIKRWLCMLARLTHSLEGNLGILPFVGVCLAVVFGLMFYIGMWCVLLGGLPYGVAYRLWRHCQRAFELS